MVSNDTQTVGYNGAHTVVQYGKQQDQKAYCPKIYIEINPYLLEIGKIFKDRNL